MICRGGCRTIPWLLNYAIAHYLTAAGLTASVPERSYLMTHAARLRRNVENI